MSDLISRQAAIDAIYETFCYAYCDNCEKEMNEDLCGDCHRKYQNWAASKKIISKTINSLPSAERHGKWVDVEPAPHNLFYVTCSVCGDRQTIEVANYCPMCRASMDEDEAQDLPQEAYYNKGLLRWKIKDEVSE